MSAICPRFTQNAWKKDLCSNCFKSKDEHKNPNPSTILSSNNVEKTDNSQKSNVNSLPSSSSSSSLLPLTSSSPPKGIIVKNYLNRSKKSQSVSFPKELTKIIGYGGEWSDTEISDDDEEISTSLIHQDNSSNKNDDLLSTDDDEDYQELMRLTKSNTDFNMNNGNLLGDPEENIKKTFAALRLGTPQIDSSGKKQTLKISVTPFGATNSVQSKTSTIKTNIELSKDEKRKFLKKDEKQQQHQLQQQTLVVNDTNSSKELLKKSDEEGNVSPPIERAMERSLLDEISETLEKKQQNEAAAIKKIQSDKDGKIKFEITSLSTSSRLSPDLQRCIISRKCNVTTNIKDTNQIKSSKLSIFPKCSDSESNTSDGESNGISAYYDVVETTSSNGYENIPDGHDQISKDQTDSSSNNKNNDSSSVEICSGNNKMLINTASDDKKNKSIYSSSQYITDMLLSSKTHSASYSLREGSFMTSKITTDGLIVTKCNSDDALDSTGSSFDGSSDEETSYNMNRSESDSGIGISIGNDYQSTTTVITTDKDLKDKKVLNKNSIIGNSDYEDIQIVSENSIQNNKADKIFAMIEKSRELAGEPDGSADPDGGVEVVPALPKTPPPPIVADGGRMSFFHGSQKTASIINNKKPEVPAKPSVSIIKTFAKRTPTNVEQQVITQLQQVIKQTPSSSNYNSQENLTLTKKEGNDCSKLLKKGRAPNPPPNSPSSPIIDDKFNSSVPTESVAKTKHQQSVIEVKQVDVKSFHQPSLDVKKDESKSLTTIKSEEQHATIYTRNPSVGIKSSSPVIREKDKRERATINPKFRSLNTFNTNRRSQLIKPSTPEPTPRKNLSMSEECLADEKKKKSKFSIKKFLRMGTSKTTDSLHKKDNVYSEVVAGDEPGVSGKPRLVIIHPIDINPTAVEVVKEIKATDTTSVVTGKPPAPPQRSSNIDRSSELNKPARPPPPKSAELRRRQKIGFNVNGTGSVKCKSDNVYANLGEIRSAIAPRKPERTASMREREAQLELAKKRQGNENSDTMSICSSNEGNITPNDLSSNALGSDSSALNNKVQTQQQQTPKLSVVEISPKEEKLNSSTYERRKLFENEGKIASKLELFERGSTISMDNGKYRQSLNDGLKNSVLKINNTIDNYLKDKRDFEALYENSDNTAKTTNIDLKRTYETIMLSNRPTGRSSFPDTASVSGMSCTRSEYGISRYGINNSFANIPRVVSASYCGSEMSESDIYSPYSFYGSESGGDVTNDIHDGVWGVSTGTKPRVKTTNRLRMRKGRSVVHKSIEDNYSAVVVANHEALAQVLDQLQQSPVIPFALRSLANAVNLRFEDFTIIEGAQAFVVGKRAFHAAIWTTTPVTLALSADCNAISGVSGELNQLSGGISGALNPITEFCDLVPSYHLPLMPSTEVRMLQATISVLPRMQLDTLQSIGTILKNRSQVFDKHISNFRGSIPNLNQGQKETTQNLALRNVCSVQNLTTLSEECAEKIDDVPTANTPGMPSFDDVMCREVGFIMLQLVNGLKNLQSKAIEEMPLSLSNVILCKEIDNKEAQARLCVLQGMNNDEDESMGTLCKCAHIALTEMLPSTKLTSLLSEILLQERSESLSKAKSILEFILWGPSDVTLNGSIKERELALQRWLDLERATVLHGLVRTRVELTVYDECHLMFLVRSNAKIMNEAAKIVSNFEKNNNEKIL